jgi:hypothetical protein
VIVSIGFGLQYVLLPIINVLEKVFSFIFFTLDLSNMCVMSHATSFSSINTGPPERPLDALGSSDTHPLFGVLRCTCIAWNGFSVSRLSQTQKFRAMAPSSQFI